MSSLFRPIPRDRQPVAWHMRLPSLSLLWIAAMPGLAVAQQLEAESPELPTLSVSGQGGKQVHTTPSQDFLIPVTRSATRTDTPVRDVPQSVTVVPDQVMKDLAATRVDTALRYGGGFDVGNTFGGLSLDNYVVRGFATSEYYRNGFAAGARGYQPMPDASTIQNVDLLRGPAALVFGRGDPGGTFNIETKQPLDQSAVSVNSIFGGYALARGSVDATGALNADHTLLYRLNVAGERSGSFRNTVHSNRQVVSPVLSWRASPNTTVTLETQLMQADATFDRGVVPINNQLGPVPISTFLGEPDDKLIRNKSAVIQLRVDHQFNQNWSLRGGVQVMDGALTGFATEGASLPANSVLMSRSRRYRDYHWNDLIAQTYATGHLATGRVRHTLLLGAEFERYTERELFMSSNAKQFPDLINVLNPVYTGLTPPLGITNDTQELSYSGALVAQDQMDLTRRLKFLLGLRLNYFNQQIVLQNRNTTTSQSDLVPTPRAGLVYEVSNAASVYASVAQSFKPNSGVSASGTAFAPEQGTAYEVGTKLDLIDNRLSIQAALFTIDKSNVLTVDPTNANFNIAAGEARSRGFDVAIAGSPAPGWQVIGGYAFTDAMVTKDAQLAYGTPLINVPRHTLSLLNVYEVQTGPLKGLGVGAGVIYRSNRAATSNDGGIILPSYVTLDALAYYKLTQHVQLAVNATNLTDATYYANSLGALRIMPGSPRTVFGNITFNF
ncbi:Outer membrane siderophore receptor [Granulibacter bethesdensis CGDNIH1]|uniref:Outer membrane siderophore receptor n=2 Tax=Granulibacter bethesdensis TaxID=364410 RepID=Q0BS09_GRABC|nr:Outer membrane siderophore receptor [Granulibacter bethesdensis CGDNIH1]APH52225.1 Outer membrane siderophore receptor [Granulibacter bethesdensis]APH64918.1 Outer membrane siderophore receptor [Granulibacter bethesdensis]